MIQSLAKCDYLRAVCVLENYHKLDPELKKKWGFRPEGNQDENCKLVRID
nr:MAG TPA: hypothetical protein [Caudoviricetes sp.]